MRATAANPSTICEQGNQMTLNEVGEGWSRETGQLCWSWSFAELREQGVRGEDTDVTSCRSTPTYFNQNCVQIFVQKF